MADVADIASETVEYCTDEALRRARGKSAPEQHPDFDGENCVAEDCGVPIPPARLALGKVRCICCQERLERVLH